MRMRKVVCAVWRLFRCRQSEFLSFGNVFPEHSVTVDSAILDHTAPLHVVAICKKFSWTFGLLALCSLLQQACSIFFSLVCFGSISYYLDDATQKMWWGLFLACLCFVLTFATALLVISGGFLSIDLRVRATCFIRSKIVQSVMSMVRSSDMGKAGTLFMTDAQTMVFIVTIIYNMVFYPVTCLACACLLAWYLGVFVVPVVVVWILIAVVELLLLGPQLQKWESKRMGHLDKRMNATVEALDNIIAVKCENLGNLMTERVMLHRTEERRITVILGLLEMCMGKIFPEVFSKLPAIIVFATLLSSSAGLSASSFVFLSLFSLAGSYHLGFASLMQTFFQARSSSARVENFISATEKLTKTSETVNFSCTDQPLVLTEACFQIGSFTLPSISLSGRVGDFIGIKGASGVGKSVLLRGVIGELRPMKGQKRTSGHVAYAPQDPWVFPGSIRDNITFTNMVLNEKRYAEVLHATCLIQDLDVFPDRDLAVLSGDYDSVSGGQKQRICLARALYSTATVVALDDCLSAVDNAVSAKILKRMVRICLPSRCVVLASSSGKYDEAFTQTLILCDDGRIEIISSDKKCSVEKLESQNPALRETTSLRTDLQQNGNDVSNSMDRNVYFGGASTNSTFSDVKLFLRYLAVPAIFPAALLALAIALDLFSGFWLSLLINDSLATLPKTTWLLVYSLLLFGYIVFFGVSFFCTVLVALAYNNQLHHSAIHAVIHAKFRSLAQLSIKEVYATLSSGLIVLDRSLSGTVFGSLAMILLLLGLICFTGFLYPVSLAMFPFAVLFPLILFRRFHESIYASFTSCLNWQSETVGVIRSIANGIVVIRSFGAESWALHNAFRLMNELHLRLFMSELLKLAYDAAVYSMRSLLILAACMIAVLLKGSVAGSGALFLLYSFLLIEKGSNLTTIFRGIGVGTAAINRLRRVAKLTQEDDFVETQDFGEWPKRGLVEFNRTCVSFDGRMAVSASFSVQCHWKVGVVGRTGSGKSTLVGTLPRIWDFSGEILIDGVDLRTVSLYRLRNSVGFIPQKQAVFSGSVQFNIDPMGKRSATELESILKLFGVSNVNIHSIAAEELSNAGIAQVVCFLRAVAKDSTVLVSDEATASMDASTQKALVQNFHSAKVSMFWVAHKLDSLTFCDKIAVMDCGRIVEYRSPNDLAADFCSVFVELLNSADVKPRFTEKRRVGVECLVCSKQFDFVRKMKRCQSCGQLVCIFCIYNSRCTTCWSNEPGTSVEVHLALAATYTISRPNSGTCCDCQVLDALSWSCASCSEPVCCNCCILFRENLWVLAGLRSGVCCRACVIERVIPALDRHTMKGRTDALIEKLSLQSQFLEHPLRFSGVKSSCSECNENDLFCISCSSCGKVVCLGKKCCVFVFIPEFSKHCFTSVCVQCLEKVSYRKRVGGAIPPPFALTEAQMATVDKLCDLCYIQISLLCPSTTCLQCRGFVCYECVTVRLSGSPAIVCLKCLYQHDLAQIERAVVTVCDFCSEVLHATDELIVNTNKIHTACLSQFRSAQQSRVCAYCKSAFLSADRVVMNGVQVHAACLPGFRKLTFESANSN